MSKAIALAYLALLAAACWAFTPDDTYISATYARNLPELGMNPGQRYEGYVCPLWLPVCRGGVTAAKACSALAAGLCVALWPILAAIPWLSMHAVSGMETAAAMLLAGLAVTLYRRKRWALASLSMLVLALLRPEAALASPLLLLKPAARRWALVGMIVPFAGYWLSRWLYFGVLLPAPIEAKLAGAPPFNYGYRYAMPLAAALAARYRPRGRYTIVAMLVTLPLAVRAVGKAQEYSQGLESGYGAVASIVQAAEIKSLRIDTPGLIAYRTVVRIVDPNGIAAPSTGDAEVSVRISPWPMPGAIKVNPRYWLVVE